MYPFPTRRHLQLGDQPPLSPYLLPKIGNITCYISHLSLLFNIISNLIRTYQKFAQFSNLMTPSYSNSIILIIVIPSLLLSPSTSRPLPSSAHRSTLTAAPENATWQLSARFPAVSDLKRYFHRFGYLSSTSGNFTDLFDEGLQSAISLYQSKLGLPITGKLDPATEAELATPRCGVPDGGAPAAAAGVKRFAFFRGQPSWDRPRPFTLTYAFSPVHFVEYLDRKEVAAAFARAFERWAAVIPVRFLEVVDYASADIRIGFYAGAHGDGEPFDGVLGILAHAFSPESGRLHLDASETWALDFGEEPSRVAVDLESVATHEIGHVLGLGHTSVKEAVMYPSLSPRTKKVDLRLDDVEGAQALYGSNPDFRFSSLAQSDTSDGSSLGDGTGRRWSEAVTMTAAAAATVALICIL